MLLATTLLAFSLLGAPEKSCTAPSQTGIFRITAITRDSTDAKLGMLLLEHIDNCLEVSMLLENGGPAVIDNLSFAGDVLTGRIRLPTGNAKVTLRITATDVAGSIVEGKHEWQVSGRRTSGGESRMAIR
jgi:hypothetical protein